ncbi:hypothetical protein G9H71_20190, partial [Motilibacter sp. E257]
AAATSDDPRTVRVDEHAAGVQASRQPAAAASVDGASAREGRANAAELAAIAYPQPVTSTGAEAAKATLGATAAVAGQAAPATAADAGVTAAAAVPSPATPAPAAPRRRAARP